MFHRARGNAHVYNKCLKTPQPSQLPNAETAAFTWLLSQWLVWLPGISTHLGRGYQCRKFEDPILSRLVLVYGEYEELVKLPTLLSHFSCSLCWSQNRRIIWAGRDLRGHVGQPLHEAAPIKSGCAEPCPDGVIILLRVETTASVGSCSSVSTALCMKKNLLISNPNFLRANLHLLPCCTSGKSPLQTFLCPTFR